MADDECKIIFSKNLKYYMDLNQKNQTDLMHDLNLSSSTVSNWCTGLKFPRMDKIQMLADYFGILKSDLIEEYKTDSKTLTSRDNKDIAKDLETIMNKLTNKEEGPAAFEGEEIPEADQELFAGQLELMLRRLKAINKEKYNPTKNKK